MVGKSRKRGHGSSYRLLMSHLLKWQFQPGRRSRSWQNTIVQARKSILNYEGMSRGRRIDDIEFEHLYELARRIASDETGLPLHAFPSTCPYTPAFLRDPHAMPD